MANFVEGPSPSEKPHFSQEAEAALSDLHQNIEDEINKRVAESSSQKISEEEFDSIIAEERDWYLQYFSEFEEGLNERFPDVVKQIKDKFADKIGSVEQSDQQEEKPVDEESKEEAYDFEEAARLIRINISQEVYNHRGGISSTELKKLVQKELEKLIVQQQISAQTRDYLPLITEAVVGYFREMGWVEDNQEQDAFAETLNELAGAILSEVREKIKEIEADLRRQGISDQAKVSVEFADEVVERVMKVKLAEILSRADLSDAEKRYFRDNEDNIKKGLKDLLKRGGYVESGSGGNEPPQPPHKERDNSDELPPDDWVKKQRELLTRELNKLSKQLEKVDRYVKGSLDADQNTDVSKKVKEIISAFYSTAYDQSSAFPQEQVYKDWMDEITETQGNFLDNWGVDSNKKSEATEPTPPAQVEEVELGDIEKLSDDPDVANLVKTLDDLQNIDMAHAGIKEATKYKTKLESQWLAVAPKLSSSKVVDNEELSKEAEKIRRRYYESMSIIDRLLNPEVATMTMEQIVNNIENVQRIDPFRWSESKSPSSAMSDRDRAILSRFFALATTPVYESEEIIKQIIASAADNKIVDNDQDNVEAYNQLLAYFKSSSEGAKSSAGQKLIELMQFLQSKGLSEQRINQWGVEVYKELFKQEVERVYWKVHLQLHCMSNEMEVEQSASRNRSILMKEIKRCILHRDELLLATTYNPEFGADIRNILTEIMEQAALRDNEVVVKRYVKRNTRTVDLRLREEEVEVRQKVFCWEALTLSGNARKDAIRAWKEALRVSGEEIIREPDPDSLAVYSGGLGNTENGDKKLAAAINRYETDDRAKDMAGKLFMVFDLLTASLAELQKNTCTRSNNNDVEDKDRISLLDPLAGAIHRMFRYEGNLSDWASYILLYFDHLPGSTRLYEGDDPGKRGFNEQPAYLTAARTRVREENLPRYGKITGIGHGERFVVPEDHQYLVDLQQSLGEWAEQFYDWFNLVPKIRLRGFCESLGFSTKDLLFLNDAHSNRFGKPEQLWDGTRGLVSGPDGVVNGNEILNLKSVVDLQSKSNPTEFTLYATAEENGFMELLEKLYGQIASGPINAKELFTGKALIHNLYKIWGKIKMYPSPLARDALVPLSYDYIVRSVQSINKEELDNAEEIFEDVVNALIQNMEDESGLKDYRYELSILINLLCKKPIYRETNNGEIERIPGVRAEPATSMYHHGVRYSKKNRYAVTYWVLERLRKGKNRLNPNETVIKRPPIFESTGVLKDVGMRAKQSIGNALGVGNFAINELIALLSGTQIAPRPVTNNGVALIQPKENKKE